MRPTPKNLRSTLTALDKSDLARPGDLALARLLGSMEAEHAPEHAAAVGLTSALASVQAHEGHSTVEIADWAGRPFPGEPVSEHETLPVLPDLDAWRDALGASHVVGAPGDATPLVFDGERVALARFWHAEQRVAGGLGARARGGRPPTASGTANGAVTVDDAEDPDAGTPEALPVTADVQARFERLFPPRADGTLDRQAVAAAAALRQRVLFVAGGPGTGKTYTAARLLSVLEAAAPALDVALAAPTGKAAQRLGESLADAVGAMADDAVTLRHAPRTLHTLLGASRTRPGYRYGPTRPLPHDLVLVDEGSMVSLPLFDALLAALAPDARLIVLGDPDQLESVEAGAVFGDVCALGRGPGSAAFAEHCAALGLTVPSASTPAPLADAVVTLTESRRFAPDAGVGRLADALRRGDADGVRDALGAGAEARAVEAVSIAHSTARTVLAADGPRQALGALGRRKLLAAVRRGAHGVDGLNAALEARLRDEGRVRWTRRGEPYHGQPLLVTENRHADGLANGDIGVCWEADGERAVFFPAPVTGATPDGVRRVPVGMLPPTEPAWALTIHKSQGSEYDAVGVVLPDPERRRRPLTRGLLYTAVTRARDAVVVFGAAEDAAEAATQTSDRASGLRDRLAARLADGA